MISIAKISNRLISMLKRDGEIIIKQKWMKSTKKQQNQQSSAELLYSQEEKNKYTVFKDYLVPSRPKQLNRLQLFLFNDPDFNSKKLSLMEIKYEMKSLTPKQVKHYTQQMQIYNSTVIAKQQSQCDRLYKTINKLPFYYNMLVAKAGLGEIQRKQKQQQTNEQVGEQKMEMLQQAKKIQMSEEQMNLQLTEQDIYIKLQTLHPLIKCLTYQECQRIHRKQLENKTYFNKHAFRVPQLYFYHPYQLYLIDQFKPDIRSLKKQEHFIDFHEINSFGQKFDKLSSDKRHHYEDKAQSLLQEYDAKMAQIVKKAGISRKRLDYLVRNQFQEENYNYYDAIR